MRQDVDAPWIFNRWPQELSTLIVIVLRGVLARWVISKKVKGSLVFIEARSDIFLRR